MVRVQCAENAVDALLGALTAIGAKEGFGMDGRSERPFSTITAADLADDERLGTLFVEAARRGWWPAGNAAVLEFWCLAEKAREEDREGTPGRLFHALVRKKVARVSNAQEIRAMARMGSEAREALSQRARAAKRAGRRRKPRGEDRASKVVVELTEAGREALYGDPGVGYQHSAFMQVFLPQKRPSIVEREHAVRHGRAALKVTAGEVADPGAEDGFRRVLLPYGSRARIILPWINGVAVRERTRDIDLGESLRAFLRTLGMDEAGRRGREVTEQVEAIAAAEFKLGLWSEEKLVTRYGRIADELTFWRTPAVEAGERRVWEPVMQLSEGYYGALVERPVPVDIGHLKRLAKSPRRMDLYSWLSYRTAQIGARGRVVIRLEDLQQVFAPEIKERRYFKSKLRADLEAVGKVYRGFRVEMEGDKLVLRRSPPPVGRLRVGR